MKKEREGEISRTQRGNAFIKPNEVLQKYCKYSNTLHHARWLKAIRKGQKTIAGQLAVSRSHSYK